MFKLLLPKRVKELIMRMTQLTIVFLRALIITDIVIFVVLENVVRMAKMEQILLDVLGRKEGLLLYVLMQTIAII